VQRCWMCWMLMRFWLSTGAIGVRRRRIRVRGRRRRMLTAY
jgi:hypothetical protein